MITLLTVNPASVGTSEQTQPTTFGTTDWIEIRNDTPFQCNAVIQGTSNTLFQLSPFEHNGIPISQLVQNASLKYNQLVIVLNFAHYYTDVATESNSPTNICIVNQLSQQEAQTNTYPLYTARMNTTVSTLANILQNIGSAGLTAIFLQPAGDNTLQGTFSLTNEGLMTIGDTVWPGEIVVEALSGSQTQIFGDHIGTKQIQFTAGSISRIVYTHIASVTSTPAFFNHNLGIIPDFCFLIPNDGVLSNGNFNAYYESSSMTSTQVKLQSSSVSGIPVGLIAVKL